MVSVRKFNGEFKLKVALSAIEGNKTIAELCKEYNLHKSVICKWRNQLRDEGAIVFESSDKIKSEREKNENIMSDLHSKIGQLLMERDFLKKKLEHWSE